MDIKILFDAENNRSVAKDGEKEVGEATFSSSDYVWIIDHTLVDKEYGGQGIAKKLVEKVVDQARKEGKKLTATCPYAKHLFETSHAYDDVLKK